MEDAKKNGPHKLYADIDKWLYCDNEGVPGKEVMYCLACCYCKHKNGLAQGSDSMRKERIQEHVKGLSSGKDHANAVL